MRDSLVNRVALRWRAAHCVAAWRVVRRCVRDRYGAAHRVAACRCDLRRVARVCDVVYCEACIAMRRGMRRCAI